MHAPGRRMPCKSRFSRLSRLARMDASVRGRSQHRSSPCRRLDAMCVLGGSTRGPGGWRMLDIIPLMTARVRPVRPRPSKICGVRDGVDCAIYMGTLAAGHPRRGQEKNRHQDGSVRLAGGGQCYRLRGCKKNLRNLSFGFSLKRRPLGWLAMMAGP